MTNSFEEKQVIADAATLSSNTSTPVEAPPNDFGAYTVSELDKSKYADLLNDNGLTFTAATTNTASSTPNTASSSTSTAQNSDSSARKRSPVFYDKDTSSINSSNASLNSSSNNSMNDSKLSRNPSSAYLKKLISENSPKLSNKHTPPSSDSTQSTASAKSSASLAKKENKEREPIVSNTSSLIGFSTSFLNAGDPEGLKEYSGSSISSYDEQNDSLGVDSQSNAQKTEPLPDPTAVSAENLAQKLISNVFTQASNLASMDNSPPKPQLLSPSQLQVDDLQAKANGKTPTKNLSASKAQNKDKNFNNIESKEKRKPWYSVSTGLVLWKL